MSEGVENFVGIIPGAARARARRTVRVKARICNTVVIAGFIILISYVNTLCLNYIPGSVKVICGKRVLFGRASRRIVSFERILINGSISYRIAVRILLFAHIYGCRVKAVIVNVSIGHCTSSVCLARENVCDTAVLIVVGNTAETDSVHLVRAALGNGTELHSVCRSDEHYDFSAMVLCVFNHFKLFGGKRERIVGADGRVNLIVATFTAAASYDHNTRSSRFDIPVCVGFENFRYCIIIIAGSTAHTASKVCSRNRIVYGNSAHFVKRGMKSNLLVIGFHVRSFARPAVGNVSGDIVCNYAGMPRGTVVRIPAKECHFTARSKGKGAVVVLHKCEAFFTLLDSVISKRGGKRFQVGIILLERVSTFNFSLFIDIAGLNAEIAVNPTDSKRRLCDSVSDRRKRKNGRHYCGQTTKYRFEFV